VKALHVTVDFTDDLVHFGKRYDSEHIDQLFAYFDQIDIRRVDWHWDTWIDTYREPFGGRPNLMTYVVDAGHELAIEVHAVMKPFEMGPAVWRVPATFPRPDGIPLFETHKGSIVTVDPFLLAHPEMQHSRIPGASKDDRPVRSLKLVKSDDGPAGFGPEDLGILTGPKIGALERYAGEVRFSNCVEWRLDFPTGGLRRVITLEGLDLGTDDRFVVVTCDTGAGTFTNTLDNLLELCDESGERIPSTPASWRMSAEGCRSRSPIPELTAYGRSSEVVDFLEDTARVERACETAYLFDETVGSVPRTLDVEGGFAGAMRGRSAYLVGTLSPIYTEVQDRWLEIIGDCLEADVDGVNIRAAGHSSHVHDRDEYGFNQATFDGDHIDRDATSRANGDAYTTFLRRAKEKIADAGKVTSLHVNATFEFEDDRRVSCNLPPNIDWQWETWVREIADVVHLKDMHFLRTARADHFIDRATRVAKEAGRPVVYIGTNKELWFSGEHDRTRYEMALARNHPRVDAYQLYEAASFTRVVDGRVEGSEEIAGMVREVWMK